MTEIPATHVSVGAIGWAILQSPWQGALMGALTALVLRALRAGSAHVRYIAACLGLIALALQLGPDCYDVRPERRARCIAASDPRRFDPRRTTRGWRGVRADGTRTQRIADEGAHDPVSAWPSGLQFWSATVVPLWFIGV
jgi:hypothetical protein